MHRIDRGRGESRLTVDVESACELQSIASCETFYLSNQLTPRPASFNHSFTDPLDRHYACKNITIVV